ncbi:hypothetical protein E2P81_ATG10595, partial [Venturia nashicola]
TPAARPKDGMNIYPSPIWPNTKDDEIFNSEQWKGCQRDQPDTSYVQFPIFANGTQYEANKGIAGSATKEDPADPENQYL